LISPSNSQSPTQKHMVVTRASDAARRLKQLTSTAVPFGSGLFLVNHWALGERCKTKSPDPW
jgi:hypothetical protein